MKHFSNRALACLALSLFARLLYANDGGFLENISMENVKANHIFRHQL